MWRYHDNSWLSMIIEKNIKDKDISLLLVMTLSTNSLLAKAECSTSDALSDSIKGMRCFWLSYFPVNYQWLWSIRQRILIIKNGIPHNPAMRDTIELWIFNTENSTYNACNNIKQQKNSVCSFYNRNKPVELFYLPTFSAYFK